MSPLNGFMLGSALALLIWMVILLGYFQLYG